MSLRTFSLAFTLLAMVALPRAARADFAIGGFLGDPTGLDLKFGVERRGALDIVVGSAGLHDLGDDFYGHLTYLVTPFIGHGDSVLVPFRLGIGAAFFEYANDVDVGVRFPLEVGLRFRSAPLEIYGELALLVTFIRPNNNYDLTSLQGGVGIRFYF